MEWTCDNFAVFTPKKNGVRIYCPTYRTFSDAMRMRDREPRVPDYDIMRNPVVNVSHRRRRLRRPCHDGIWGSGHFKRSEEHTSELQSLMRISYAVFCLKKKKNQPNKEHNKT